MITRSDSGAAAPPGQSTDAALLEINRLWTIVRAFSNTAHDVNNALQVISGSAELLEARELDPAVAKRVEAIRGQAAKAAATIERLLSYARYNGAAAVHTVDLASIVESAVAMRAGSLIRARIAVRFDRSDSAPYWIVADRHRALQAVLSLLLSSEDDVRERAEARIDVRLERQGEGVRVSISGSVAAGIELAAPADRSPTSPAGTTGRDLLSAARLAAEPAGQLTVTEGQSGARTLALTFPAASPPPG